MSEANDDKGNCLKIAITAILSKVIAAKSIRTKISQYYVYVTK